MFSSASEHWPGWRGPEGTGVYRGKPLPVRWSAKENVRWRVPLPGPGSSSPVVWQSRVFISQATERFSTIMCFDRNNGELLWQVGVTVPILSAQHSATGTMASPSNGSATPVTDGIRIVALHGPALHCLDFDGEELWLRELENEDPTTGLAASPVLFGELCIVNLLNPPRLEALNKETGELVWTRSLTSLMEDNSVTSPNGNDSICSTPILVESPECQELVVNISGQMCAFSPHTGRPLWTCARLGGLPYASPLRGEDLAISAGSFSNATVLAVKLGGEGDVTQTHRLWLADSIASSCGSGVIHDEHLFLVNENNFALCLDARTGKTTNKQRLGVADQADASWSSLLLANGRIYAPHSSGKTVIFRAHPDLEVLTTNSMGEPLRSSLGASHGELFLRTDNALWCIGEEMPKGEDTACRE